jgi:hypothetical protein
VPKTAPPDKKRTLGHAGKGIEPAANKLGPELKTP